MWKNRKIYETTLDAQLAQWSADLDVLKAKAARAEVNAKVNYDKAIDAMQQKHDEASKRLRALKVATDDTWDNLKTGTERICAEVKTLFEKSPK